MPRRAAGVSEPEAGSQKPGHSGRLESRCAAAGRGCPSSGRPPGTASERPREIRRTHSRPWPAESWGQDAPSRDNRAEPTGNEGRPRPPRARRKRKNRTLGAPGRYGPRGQGRQSGPAAVSSPHGRPRAPRSATAGERPAAATTVTRGPGCGKGEGTGTGKGRIGGNNEFRGSGTATFRALRSPGARVRRRVISVAQARCGVSVAAPPLHLGLVGVSLGLSFVSAKVRDLWRHYLSRPL